LLPQKTILRIMDYVRDQNPRPLYRIDALAGTPAYVAEAPVLTEDSVAKLASVAFAAPGRREFPCFDKVSTYLSYAYLRGANLNEPAVAARIKQAGVTFGIADDLEKIDHAVAQSKQASAPVQAFALPAGVCKEASANLYPIGNEFEIEESARQLANDRARMPASAFRTAAMAIVKAAAAHGTVLPAKVAQAGEDRYPDFAMAERILALRKAVVKSAEAVILYDDLVKAAAAAASEEEAEKFASLCAELDQTCGVQYRDGIVDPWSAIFSGPLKSEVEKLASEFVFLAEAPVPRTALETIPAEKITQHFSKATGDKIMGWRKAATAAEITTAAAQLELSVQRQLLRLALAV
jgi:hypothetical protein